MFLLSVLLLVYFSVYVFFYFGSLDGIFTSSSNLQANSTTSLATTGGKLRLAFRAGTGSLWRARRAWLVILVLLLLILLFEIPRYTSRDSDPNFSALDNSITKVFIPGYKLLISPIRGLASVYNAVIPFTNAWAGLVRVFWNSAFEIMLECRLVDWNALTSNVREFFSESYVSIFDFVANQFDHELNVRTPLNKLRLAFLHGMGLFDCECHMLRNMWNLVEVFVSPEAVEEFHQFLNFLISVFLWPIQILRDVVYFVYETITIGFTQSFRNWYWKPQRGFDFARSLTHFSHLIANTGSVVDNAVAVLAESFGGIERSKVPKVASLFTERVAQMTDSLNVAVASFVRYPLRTAITWINKYRDDSTKFALGKAASQPVFHLIDVWHDRYRNLSNDVIIVMADVGAPLIELCDHSLSCSGPECCTNDRWRDFGNRLGRAIEAFGRVIAAGRNVIFIQLEGSRRIFATLRYTCYFCEERGGSGRQEVQLIVDDTLDETRLESTKLRDAIEDLLEIIDKETAEYYREATHVTESIVDLIRALATSSRGGRLSRRRYMHSEQYLQDVDRIFFEVESSFVALANIIRQFALDFPLSKRADSDLASDVSEYYQSMNAVVAIRTQQRSKRRSSVDYRAYVTNKQQKEFATTCAFRDPHSTVIEFHPRLADAENLTISDVYAPPDVYVEPLCCFGNTVEEGGLLVAGLVKSFAEVIAISLHASSLREAAVELLRGPLNLRRDVIPVLDALLRDRYRNHCFRLGMVRLISEQLDFIGLPARCTSGAEPYALLLRIMTRMVRAIVQLILEVLQLGIDILLSFVDGTASSKFRAYFVDPANRGIQNKRWYLLTIGQVFDFFRDLLDLIGCSANLDEMKFFSLLTSVVDFFASDGMPECTNLQDDVKTFTDLICRMPLIINRIVEGVLAFFSGDFIGYLRDLFSEFFTDALSCSNLFSAYFLNWLTSIPYDACIEIRNRFPKIGGVQLFNKVCYNLDAPLTRVYDANYEIYVSKLINCEGQQPLINSCGARWWYYRNSWTYYEGKPRCFRPSRQMPFGCFRTKFSDRKWLQDRSDNDLGCCGVPTGANIGPETRLCCGGRASTIIRSVNCNPGNFSCCSTNGNWCGISFNNNYCRNQYGNEGKIRLPGDKSGSQQYKRLGDSDNATLDFSEIEYNNTASDLVPYINFTDPEAFSALTGWCLMERFAMEKLYQDLTPALESAESDEEQATISRKRGLDQAAEAYIECVTSSALLAMADQALIMATEDEGSDFDIREFARDSSRTLFTPSTAFSKWKLALAPINFLMNFPVMDVFSGRAAEVATEAGSAELYVRLAKLADNGMRLYNQQTALKSEPRSRISQALPKPRDVKSLPIKRVAKSLVSSITETAEIFGTVWSGKLSWSESGTRHASESAAGIQAVRDLFSRRLKWRNNGSPPFAEPFPAGSTMERHYWSEMLQDEMDFVEKGDLETATKVRARRVRLYPRIEQEHLIMEDAELASSESRHLRRVHSSFLIDNQTSTAISMLKGGDKNIWADWRANSCLAQDQVGDCVQSRLQTIICPATDGIANLKYCELRSVHDFSGDSMASVRCRTAITALGLKPSCEKYEFNDAEGYCCNVFNQGNSVPALQFENCSALGSAFRFIEDPLEQLDLVDFEDLCSTEYAFYCFNSTSNSCTQIASLAECSGGHVTTGSNRCGPFQTSQAACCVNSTCRLTTLANCELLVGVWHYGQSCNDEVLHGSCGHCAAPTCQRCDVVLESVSDLVDLWVLAVEDVSRMRYGACCRANGTCDVTNSSSCPLETIISDVSIRSRRELPPVCLPGVNCRATVWRWGQDCGSCWFVNETRSVRDPVLLRMGLFERIVTTAQNNVRSVTEKWQTASNPGSGFELPPLNLTQSGDLPERIRLRVGVRFIFWVQGRSNALLGIFGIGPIDVVRISSQIRYFFDLNAPRSDPRTLKYWFLIVVTCDPINHSRCDRAPFGLGLPLGLLISTLIVGGLGFVINRVFPTIWGVLSIIFLVVIFIWLVVVLSWAVSPICFRPPRVPIFKSRTVTNVPRVASGQRVTNRLRGASGDRVGAMDASAGKWSRRASAGGRALVRIPLRVVKFVLRTSWNLPVSPNCGANETVDFVDYEAACYEPNCKHACPHRENVWPCGWIPKLPGNETCSVESDCCATSPCPLENEIRLFPNCMSEPYNFDGPGRVAFYYLSWLSRSLNDQQFANFVVSNSATLADASTEFPADAFTDGRWRYCAISESTTIIGILLLIVVAIGLAYALVLPILYILLVSAITMLQQIFVKFDKILKKASVSRK